MARKRIVKKRLGVLETMGDLTESVEAEEKEPSTKKESERKEKLLQRAKDRYKVISEYWQHNRDSAIEAIRFRHGEQWPEKIKKDREKDGRPALVLDKLSQYIRQVVNDGRQNRPAIKFRPVDDKGDIKVANAFQGLTRSILAKSRADQAFDTALDHAAGHGFGYFRVLTDYVEKGSFEQEIKVLRVRNPLSVLLGPHQEADGADAEDGFVLDVMTKAAFKAKYPKAEKVDWQQDSKSYAEGWLDGEFVTVAEYWYKEPTEEVLFQLEDGAVVKEDEYNKSKAEFESVGLPVPAIKNTRVVVGHKVKWCRMTGAEILEERDWLGEFIPIIPVYGTETDIEGKVTYSGLIQPGMHGQMLYNFARTAFAERVALTPKAPFVAADGQVEHNPDWQEANTKNVSVLTYNPISIDGTVLPAPQRQPASDVPTGFAQEMQMAEHDIQSALGMYNASLGEQSNEKSGRAILARQREGDVSTFHFHDNLNRAIQCLGRQLLDLIPKVYDTQRAVRLMEEDGTVTDAMIAPELPNGVPVAKAQNGVEIFNLGAGRYDVETSTGPSFTTKRQEAAEAMIEIAGRNPEVWKTHGDLLVKSQDWPGADEWAKRTLALMPSEMRSLIEKAESEDGPDDKVKAVMEAAEAEIQKRDQQIQEMLAMLQQAKKDFAEVEKESKAKDEANEIKAFEAETKRVELLMPYMTPAQLAVLTTQAAQMAATPEDLVTSYLARKALEAPQAPPDQAPIPEANQEQMMPPMPPQEAAQPFM